MDWKGWSLFLCMVLCLLEYANPATITWKNDDIRIAFGNSSTWSFSGPVSNNTLSMSGHKVNITAEHNGLIYDDGDSVGHFQLRFRLETQSHGTVMGKSACIGLHHSQMRVKKLVEDIVWSNNSKTYNFSDIVTDARVQKFKHIKANTSVTTFFIITLEGRAQLRAIDGYLMRAACANPRTTGDWKDTQQWVPNQVPLPSDDVVIPANAGVIEIPYDMDVTVGSLKTYGGLIRHYHSVCPDGWASNPSQNPSKKCYKKFDSQLKFYDADKACQTSSGYGSMDAHLVQISDMEELTLVKRLCRGQLGTITTVAGCWIGLHDPTGAGKYGWIESRTVGETSFRDWRRYEWNNHTFSEGQSTNGELCVQMVPWESDALIMEQGSFNDVACELKKPFVCQMFAKTQRGTITVSGTSSLAGGGMEGTNLLLKGRSDIIRFFGHKAAQVTLEASAGNDNTLQEIILEEGSSLVVNANFSSSAATYIGEKEDLQTPTTPLRMQSEMTMAPGTRWTIQGRNYSASIYARANLKGDVFVDPSINFNLKQGGALSQASFDLKGNTTYLNLGGGSQLSTYDSYILQLKHRGPVIGEYINEIAHEVIDPTNSHLNSTGVYKLRLQGAPGTNVAEITECIPYHSKAQDLATIIAKLPVVQARGGVTVRRYGDGTDPLYNYGYTYRIEMDAPPTAVFALGSLTLDVYCYGIHSCGCAETKVPLVDSTGQRMCPRKTGNSSRVEPSSCVTNPTITVKGLTRLSYTAARGAGSIVIADGTHRLPPKSDVLISSASLGLGIVAADSIEWGGIAVDGVGTIICAGSGWSSWDSATNVFGPDWWDIRGYVRMLETAPPFNMMVQKFILADRGSILTASPKSNMTWASGEWKGGTIGGRSTLNIKGNVTASGTNKALRYGITVFVQASSTLTWTEGNISLANGARLIVEGTLDCQTIGMRKYIGEAHLLDSAVPAFKAMLKTEMSRQWHGYFGLEIPAELRGGWYNNPLCGEMCEKENFIWFRENGKFLTAPSSNTSFNCPVNMLGKSRMVMGTNAYVEMASGGICGNQVIVNISTGTIYTFVGGRMSMRATCKIQGEGELLVAGGAHDMSFSIDAHITIAGGAMIWPQSRGDGKSITFNGGLLISGDGQLKIEPYSTQIKIYGEVIFRNKSLLQFPMMGIAAQASNSDRPDAPDPTPRGRLTSVDTMRWDGGTLRGKADFVSEKKLYIGGGLKQIRSLAKLVNKGHAEWDDGNIVMADNADFMNLGTVQMARGNEYFNDNLYYEGTILPTEAGGDAFAKNFHSYEVDGKLDYSDYVNLRTQFVSRAPPGWNETDQSTVIPRPTNIV